MQGAASTDGWKATLDQSNRTIESYTDLLGTFGSKSPRDSSSTRTSSESSGGWWDAISSGGVLGAVGSWLDGPESSKWVRLVRCVRSCIGKSNGEMSVLEEAISRDANFVEENIASVFEQSSLRECAPTCREEDLARELTFLLMLKELRRRSTEVRGRRSEIQRRRGQLRSQSRLWTSKGNEVGAAQFSLLQGRQCRHKRMESATNFLDRIVSMNGLSDVFHIWFHGPFGTINGFRIGQLSATHVSVNEISAGLGQLALLLCCMGDRLGFRFGKYVLVPRGSHSRIKIPSQNQDFPLYEEETTFSLFSKKRFSDGLVSLADCLRLLGEHISGKDPSMQQPYIIDIPSLSIGQPGIEAEPLTWTAKPNDEKWTKGMKYLLINAKWAVVWFSKKAFDG